MRLKAGPIFRAYHSELFKDLEASGLLTSGRPKAIIFEGVTEVGFPDSSRMALDTLWGSVIN